MLETTRSNYMLMAMGNISCLHMLSSKIWRDCGGKVQGVLEEFYSCQDQVVKTYIAAMSANTVTVMLVLVLLSTLGWTISKRE